MIRRWLSALIQDPDGSPSSARVVGVLCGVVACVVAVGGMLTQHEYAATVAALVGGGASSLLVRRKSVGEGE